MTKRLFLYATVKKNRVETWRYDVTNMTPSQIDDLRDGSTYVEDVNGWCEIETYDDGSEITYEIDVEEC